MDLNTIILIGWGILCFIAGWHLRAIIMLKNLINDPDNMIDLLTRLKSVIEQEQRIGEPPTEHTVEVELEHHEGIVYAYDKMTGQFLGQGPSLNDVIDSARKRFPEKDFWHPELKKDSQSA
jgi:hypothetical protein